MIIKVQHVFIKYSLTFKIVKGLTITTSAFIIKKTPEKESLPTSYRCDFDEAKGCNGQITTQMDGTGVQFNATAETGLVQTYVITDVTSISKHD